jgi:hypothetical protein
MSIREKMLELNYERVTSKILKGQPKPKRIARFIDGHLYTGHASLHLTPQSRRWRTYLRLKTYPQKFK